MGPSAPGTTWKKFQCQDSKITWKTGLYFLLVDRLKNACIPSTHIFKTISSLPTSSCVDLALLCFAFFAWYCQFWLTYLIVLTMNANCFAEMSLLWLPHFDYKSHINTIQQCKVDENDQWWLNVLAFSTVTSFPSSKTARVLTSRISAVFSSNSSPSWVGYKITVYRGTERDQRSSKKSLNNVYLGLVWSNKSSLILYRTPTHTDINSAEELPWMFSSCSSKWSRWRWSTQGWINSRLPGRTLPA